MPAMRHNRRRLKAQRRGQRKRGADTLDHGMGNMHRNGASPTEISSFFELSAIWVLARGQLVPFQENDIRPAKLGQMVEDRTTNHTAANHDDLGFSFHVHMRRFYLSAFSLSAEPSLQQYGLL